MRGVRCRPMRTVVAVAMVATSFVGVPEAGASSSRESLKGTITVSAAASLSDAFTEIGKAFRARNPKVKVRFNFASSGAIVTQVLSGAPADVVAFADLSSMDRLVSSGNVAVAPTVFARNSMAIVVKPGNPLQVNSLADLTEVGVVALCVATAPCGSYAATVLKRSGVSLNERNVTRGIDVKSTLTQVANGDAQAAIVYVSDVRAAGKSVTGVAIPRASNITAMYPIAQIKGSSNAAAAKAFVNFVSSTEARMILSSWGFSRP